MKTVDTPREQIRKAVISRQFEPIEKLLNKFNVSIRDDKGEIREWADIVENIANSWEQIVNSD
jgi:flagellar biosynthesis chaperone FliJ